MSIQLLITPPGGSTTDYSANLAWSGTSQQSTITQNFGRQGDTAVLSLVDDWTGLSGPSIIISTLSQIQLNDTGLGKTLFAGVVTNPQMFVTGPRRNEWVLQCTDFTFYADKSVVQGAFKGQTVGQIICDLTNGSGSGITASLSTAGGFVDPGPVLSSFSMGYKALSAAWRQMAQQAGGSTPYGWFVDENLVLHFVNGVTAQSSGVTFTTNVTSQGAQGHFGLDNTFEYEWDATSLVNETVIQGANTTVTAALNPTPTDTWLADGTAHAWPLRFTPAASMFLVVNGLSTPVSSASAGATYAVTTGWMVQQNNGGGWFLTAPTGSTPPAGSVIQLWYNYTQPIIIRQSDYNSQAAFPGPNGGVFAAYISDSSVTTLSMAMARAQRENAEYAWPVERITFNTTEDFTGWVRCGDTIIVDNGLVPDDDHSLGIDATFLVIQNQVEFTKGGYRTMQLTAIRITTGVGGTATTTLAPGTNRPYTLIDMLGIIADQLGDQTDANPAIGRIGIVKEAIGFKETLTGTVVSASQNWDETVWGSFAWV